MIVTRLSDGLGNQLFQYAAGLALAEHHHTELAIDLDTIPVSNRRFGLRAFNIEAQVFEGGTLPKPLASRIKGRVKKHVEQVLPWHARRIVRSPHFHYAPDFFKAGPCSELHGFWQSPRYFEAIESEVRRQFSFSPQAPAMRRDVDLSGLGSVALHVRRGDYVSNPTYAAKYRLPGLDYYAEALEVIRSRVGSLRVFVFSDDLKWCDAELRKIGPMELLDCGSDIGDFRHMTLCRHHVISNSTFAWWAAWLGHSADQVVVTPKRWFYNEYEEKDLFPSAWVQL